MKKILTLLALLSVVVWSCSKDQKVVKQLETEHFIQLAIYLWLYYKTYRKSEAGFLYNIITNEKYSVMCSIENLEKIVSILCEHKKKGIDKKNDDDFISHCNLIYNKVYS